MSDQPAAATTPTNGATSPTQPPAEPPKPPATAAPTEDGFAAIRKRERVLQAERARFKAERDAATKDASELADLRAAKQAAKQKPLDALKALGLTYDEVTQAHLNGGKPDPVALVAEAKSEIDKLRTELTEKEKAAEKNRVEQAYAAFRGDIDSFLDANKDKEEFELVSSQKLGGFVFNIIKARYEKDGTELTIAQAAAEVEAMLVKNYEQTKAAKKFQAKALQSNGDKKAEVPAQARTLSNDMTVSTPSLNTAAKTEAERVKRALAALERAGN